MSLLREIQRRNVGRVATAYIVTAWLVIQVVETIFPAFGFGDEAIRIAVILLAIGFVPAVIAAWVFEWTPEGIQRDTGEAPAPVLWVGPEDFGDPDLTIVVEILGESAGAAIWTREQLQKFELLRFD